jgi:uncharacterized protein YraI
MIRRSWIAAAALCAALVMPAAAAAQTVAYATYDGYTNVREGPSTQYYVIAQLAPGTPVDVLGCLPDRAWCQILVDDLEGWVYSRRLEFVYSGQRYFVPDYYAYFGAPLVYFNFDDYPDHYRYYDRSRRHRNDDFVYPRHPDARYAREPVTGAPEEPRRRVRRGGGQQVDPSTGVARRNDRVDPSTGVSRRRGNNVEPQTGVSRRRGGGGVCPPDAVCPNID